MSALLQQLHDAVLVFGEHLAEPVRALDEIGQVRIGGLTGCRVECRGGQDVITEADLAGDLRADGDLVPGHHLHPDTELPGSGDGIGGVRPGRVGERQDAE